MSDFLPSTSPNTHAPAPDPRTGVPEPHWPASFRQQAQRAYVGTLMRWKPENGRAGAEVMDEWLDLFYLRARQVLRSLKPWPTSPGLAIIHELRDEFKPEWVIDEVAACYGEAMPWQELSGIAGRLRDGHNARARDEARAARLAIVEEMRGLCHDSEAISEKCKQLVALG